MFNTGFKIFSRYICLESCGETYNRETIGYRGNNFLGLIYNPRNLQIMWISVGKRMMTISILDMVIDRSHNFFMVKLSAETWFLVPDAKREVLYVWRRCLSACERDIVALKRSDRFQAVFFFVWTPVTLRFFISIKWCKAVLAYDYSNKCLQTRISGF